MFHLKFPEISWKYRVSNWDNEIIVNEGLLKVNLTEIEFRLYSNEESYREKNNHMINRRTSKGDLASEAGAVTNVKTWPSLNRI